MRLGIARISFVDPNNLESDGVAPEWSLRGSIR